MVQAEEAEAGLETMVITPILAVKTAEDMEVTIHHQHILRAKRFMVEESHNKELGQVRVVVAGLAAVEEDIQERTMTVVLEDLVITPCLLQ